jgi:purine-binding chemotaxis protein CheW
MTFDVFSRLPGPIEEEREHKLVVFTAGGVSYGASIMSVREVVNPHEVDPVPSAPPYVAGVADHRQNVIPVVDLRKRFGVVPEGSQREKWVIVTSNGLETALLVDGVSGVIAVEPDEQRRRHPLIEGGEAALIETVWSRPHGLLFEIDLEKVIGGAARMAEGTEARGEES